MKEMEWVIRTFRYMGEIWKGRAKEVGDEKPGHRAYAAKEIERWNRWAGVAENEFAKVMGVEAIPM